MSSPVSTSWKLRNAYRERLSTERAAARLLQTLDVLFERPILNIRQLEAALDVPYRTAQRYIERLEEIGILREVTAIRNRICRQMKSCRLLNLQEDRK
jgi:Fic family protein